MIINSSRLGSIEVDPNRVICFKDGLPGFEDLTKFILISPPELEPFHLLQSTEDGDVSLIVSDPFLFKKDYAPAIDEGVFKELKIKDSIKPLLFTTIVIPKDYKKMTANLMAPIIINPEEFLGKQVILDKGDYSLRYPIFQNSDGEVG